MQNEVNEHNTGPALLDVKGLEVTLGREKILDDISFAIQPGSICALVGPNGAGKTTLIRAIMGGMPHKGKIEFNFRGSGHIAYVPQLLEFSKSLPITVGDFITMMIKGHPIFIGGIKKFKQQVMETLAQTKTDHLYDRLLGGLSGGEFRRVMLAQALIPIPEFLVLDEAASNVDEHGALMIENIIKKLSRKKGVSVLMVTHDLTSIIRTADHIVGINRRVSYQGDPQILCDPEKLGHLFGASADSFDKFLENC